MVATVLPRPLPIWWPTTPPSTPPATIPSPEDLPPSSMNRTESTTPQVGHDVCAGAAGAKPISTAAAKAAATCENVRFIR
jgi:hypothetical protein